MTETRRPTTAALGLYAGAFLLLLVAAAFLGAAVLDELQQTRLLWVSAGLAYAAVVLALLSVLMPGKAPR